MELINKNIRSILAILIVLSFIVIAFLIVFNNADEKLIYFILGTLTGAVGTVLGFYFVDKDKTKTPVEK